MMDDNVFDDNADFFDSKVTPYQYHLVNLIGTKRSELSNFVDIGGGSGAFACLLKNTFPDMDVFVVDPSDKLFSKIRDERIKKVHGKLPNELHLSQKFDYIHVSNVFHHITVSSITRSKKLVEESLFTIKKLLKENGLLFIREEFDETYLVQTLSRSAIFYLLKIQNKLKIRVPIKEFLMNLDVCFYTRNEFKSMLYRVGFEIVEYQELYWGNTIKKKLLLLKNWGEMMFIVKLPLVTKNDNL